MDSSASASASASSLPVSYSDLKVVTATYKVVQKHEIKVDVLLPPQLKAGKAPLIIFWHGGALITGSRNFRPFFSSWLPSFATEHSAIIVSPDYRLLPESVGADILSDIEDLWIWLHSTNFSSMLSIHFADLEADLERIVITGGSAGGFCTVHQALSHPDSIRAVLLQYPLVDIDDSLNTFGTQGSAVLGMLPPMSAAEFAQTHAAIQQKRQDGFLEIVTEGDSARFPQYAIPAAVYGYVRQWIGDSPGGGPDVAAMKRIRDMSTFKSKLPSKICLAQGTSDTAVPVASTRAFVALVEECCPETKIKVNYFDGLEHGFDSDGTAEDMMTFAEGLKWVEDVWLV